MVSELAIKFINGFFVTIFIARFLGTEQFGLLSYSLSITAVIMAISKLGMDSLLVRELTKNPSTYRIYLGVGYSMMMLASIVTFIVFKRFFVCF